MPTHKSAEKQMRTAEKGRIRNKSILSAVKTAIKKVRAAKEKKAGSEVLRTALVQIDKAAKRGILKKNNAARKKSKLTLFVNSLG